MIQLLGCLAIYLIFVARSDAAAATGFSIHGINIGDRTDKIQLLRDEGRAVLRSETKTGSCYTISDGSGVCRFYSESDDIVAIVADLRIGTADENMLDVFRQFFGPPTKRRQGEEVWLLPSINRAAHVCFGVDGSTVRLTIGTIDYLRKVARARVKQ
jgi:hypothetical protein